MRTAAFLSLLFFTAPAGAALAKPLVLVELFTAQGCRPCTEANTHLGKLADRPGVLALTFSVDYWDYLGWTDTFARPEFTARQKAYVSRLQLREPYTPQIVVDGRQEVQGSKAAELDRLLRAAAIQARNPPDIRFVGARRVDVGSGRLPRGGSDVWMMRYEPGAAETQIKAGDNRGETVVQSNVVHEMKRLGAWRGKPQAYRLPAPSSETLRTIVVVQGARGGRVIGVASQGAP